MKKRPAGKYIQDSGGYQTFRPYPLPPEGGFGLDETMLALLSRSDRALGRLVGVSEILPNPDLLVMMFVKREAVLSSQIEGTQASLLDVLEYEARMSPAPGPGDGDLDAVINHIASLKFGLQQIENGVPIGTELFRDLHLRLMRNVRGGDRRPGKLRDVQNWIGPPGCTIADAVFIPPGVSDMEEALRELESFIRSDTSLPPLIKAGLVHAQFETIHPFLDGNGRIGRLLITFLLTLEGHLRRPLLYLSHFFKQNRLEYYDRLQAVRTDGDWAGWLRFFLRGVEAVSTDASGTSLRVLALRESHRKLLMDSMGRKSGPALMLLDDLYRSPMTTVRKIASATGLSYTNSNILAARLEDMGILKEITGNRRNRLYKYTDYLEMHNIG